MITFADRLNEVMSVRHINGKSLAKAAGISECAITYYRAGTRSPQVATLARLSSALEVSPIWLAGDDIFPDYDVGGMKLSEFEMVMFHLDQAEAAIKDVRRKLVILSGGEPDGPGSEPEEA